MIDKHSRGASTSLRASPLIASLLRSSMLLAPLPAFKAVVRAVWVRPARVPAIITGLETWFFLAKRKKNATVEEIQNKLYIFEPDGPGAT